MRGRIVGQVREQFSEGTHCCRSTDGFCQTNQACDFTVVGTLHAHVLDMSQARAVAVTASGIICPANAAAPRARMFQTRQIVNTG